MNRLKDMMKLFFLGLMLIFPFSAFSIPDTGETISKRGSIPNDYYAMGGTLDIDADISGDLTALGGNLFLGHRVQGDVMASGGSINIRGEILDDVRAAGGDIDIDANIAQDLIVVGGKINVSRETFTGGESWIAGGDVHMAGTVQKSLYVWAGNIHISGSINGDVELQGGEIQILEGALIQGNLHYKSPNEAKIHPGATITGNINFEQTEWNQPQRGYGVLFSLTMSVAAIALFLLFPNFTLSAVDRISSEPWKSGAVGFVWLVVTPIGSVLLMAIVLGVWIGLSCLALYFVTLPIGLLLACFFLGDWGAKLLHKELAISKHRILSVVLTIILLGFIQTIPIIGGLVTFALLLLGLGAGLMQVRFYYDQTKTA